MLRAFVLCFEIFEILKCKCNIFLSKSFGKFEIEKKGRLKILKIDVSVGRTHLLMKITIIYILLIIFTIFTHFYFY